MNRLIRFKKAFLCLTGVVSVGVIGVGSLLFFNGVGPDWLGDNNSPFDVKTIKDSGTKEDIISTLEKEETKVTITNGTCTTKDDIIKGLKGENVSFETCEFKYTNE